MSRDGVLVIGGGGFLGRALTAELVGRGRRVHVLGRRNAAGLPPQASFDRGGLSNEAALRRLLPDCATVFHLACATTPSVSADLPMLEVEENIAPTLRFLSVLRDFPDTHLIFMSSGGALYGNIGARPAREDDALNPLSFHGAGKAALEAFLHAHAARSSGPLTILRTSNLYGPGQPAREGFGIVRAMLDRARTDTPLEIWGDGEATRDFIYIDDVVAVCLRYAELAGGRETYNVGSGEGCSLNRLRSIVEVATGRRLRVNYRAPRAVDVQHIELDIARLRARLGWAPRVSLADGVGMAWRWLEEGGAGGGHAA
jgi:UDP-glucose 4-epimerase